MTSQTKVKPGAAATTTRGARPTSSTTRVVPSSNNGEGLPITVGSSHTKNFLPYMNFRIGPILFEIASNAFYFSPT